MFQVFQKYDKLQMTINMKSIIISRGKKKIVFFLKVRLKFKKKFFNCQEINTLNGDPKLFFFFPSCSVLKADF